MAHIARIYWIHPSCRDLVIEELSTQPDLQQKFLQSMSLPGIKLAVSDSGGAAGDRELPLMNHPKNWNILRERCLEVVSSRQQKEVSDLLTVLTSAAVNASNPGRKDNLSKIISSVCSAVAVKWNRASVKVSAEDLSAYCEASILSCPFSAIPNLDASWESHLEAARSAMDEAENGYVLQPEPIKKWVKFTAVVYDNEPRFLRAKGFPVKLTVDITRLITIVDSELGGMLSSDSADEYDAEAERLESLKDAFDSLIKFLPWEVEKKVYDVGDPRVIPAEIADMRERLLTYSGKLRRRINSLKEESAELTPPEPDYDDDGYRGAEDYFDVEGLFSDL